MDRKLESEINALHAQVCAALAEPKRIMILYVLADGPQNVTDLCAALGAPQPAVSRHLKVLRDSGLVTARRDGMNVVYTLSNPKVVKALDLLRQVLHENLKRTASLLSDRS
ncbi:MAG: helix-turn-helix transcriptional regulator [Chloroflexi bacterium]|nr:helix-turn-helix transcriptional regulator [Chloroflexota bacterium]